MDLPSTTVELSDGSTVTVRSLTRKEQRHVQIGFHVPDTSDLEAVEASVEAVELFLLERGLGLDRAAAIAYRDGPARDVERVIDAITYLSGLSDEKPDPLPDTSGGS